MDAMLAKDGTGFVLTVERKLPYPPERVWRVVTERELVKQWFPCDIVGEWVVGGPLEFRFMHGEGEGLPEEALRGEVIAVDEPHRLEFRWGDHGFLYELSPDGEGCHFRLSERFDDASWGARNAAGWEMCLDNLGLILDGAAALKFVAEVWRAKFDRYVQRFEPEFGEMSDPTGEHPLLTEDEEHGTV